VLSARVASRGSVAVY